MRAGARRGGPGGKKGSKGRKKKVSANPPASSGAAGRGSGCARRVPLSEPARPGRDPPWSTRWRRDAATSVPAPREAPRASEEGEGGVACAQGAWPGRAAAGPGCAGAWPRDAVGVATAGATALVGRGRGLERVGVAIAGESARGRGL